MEFIKQWCFSICVSLIAAVIFSLFTPKGRMNGFYKILLSFFIFVSFLYPLKDFNINDVKIKDFAIDNYSEDYSKIYEDKVNREIENVLKENGVTGAVVSSEININYEKSEIDIKSVRVAVSADENKENVKELVFEKTGINAEVISVGE